jgi:hypothetical protein
LSVVLQFAMETSFSLFDLSTLLVPQAFRMIYRHYGYSSTHLLHEPPLMETLMVIFLISVQICTPDNGQGIIVFFKNYNVNDTNLFTFIYK